MTAPSETNLIAYGGASLETHQCPILQSKVIGRAEDCRYERGIEALGALIVPGTTRNQGKSLGTKTAADLRSGTPPDQSPDATRDDDSARRGPAHGRGPPGAPGVEYRPRGP